MALPSLTPDTIDAYLGPLTQLRADTPRCFGTMDAAAMASHMHHTLEVSYGAAEDPPHHNGFTRGIGRILFFHLFTRWPGGMIKQPAVWSAPARSPIGRTSTLSTSLTTSGSSDSRPYILPPASQR